MMIKCVKGENKGRTEMQKSRCSFPFPFHGVRAAEMKPSCSREATPAPVSQLVSTLPSSAPYYTRTYCTPFSCSPLSLSLPAFHLLFEHGMVVGRENGPG
jgi:hypothetical protein